MKKQLFCICFFLVLISINSISQNKIAKTDSIKITGIASNAKAGAIVQTKNGNIYYIEGVSSWKEDVLNKSVEVKGYLKKEVFKKEDLQNEKGEWIQGMEGEKLTIMKPVWKKN